MSISMHIKLFVNVIFDINRPLSSKPASCNLLMAVSNPSTSKSTLYKGVGIVRVLMWSYKGVRIDRVLTWSEEGRPLLTGDSPRHIFK